MSKTKKNIIDIILNILYKFRPTDEKSVDEDMLSAMIDDARAQTIRSVYSQTRTLDQTWLSDMGLLTFYKVNRADNPVVTCLCDIGKTTIPQVITLDTPEGNKDLGIYSLMSACGKYQYTPYPMYRWQNIPPEHPYANQKWYWRLNTQMYVSDTPTTLRGLAILLNPEDGYLNNSAPIASGSIVLGTVYYVKYGTIIYDSVAYAPNTQFTGTSTTSFTTTNGVVYLYSQVESYRSTDPYPLSGDLIRQIELELLTKEFNIEQSEIPDTRNDSIDDKVKV